MPEISLRAHFDGQNIRLDEPYALPKDAPLLVTVLSPAVFDPISDGWAKLAADGLALAYGDIEPEYSSADIVP